MYTSLGVGLLFFLMFSPSSVFAQSQEEIGEEADEVEEESKELQEAQKERYMKETEGRIFAVDEDTRLLKEEMKKSDLNTGLQERQWIEELGVKKRAVHKEWERLKMTDPTAWTVVQESLEKAFADFRASYGMIKQRVRGDL